MAVTFTGAKPASPSTRMLREFSPDKFEAYGRMNLNITHIAGLERASRKTIANALKIPEIKEAYDKGRSEAVTAIRQKQISLALAGNVQLLIHVGEQFADQDGMQQNGIPESFAPEQFSWDSKAQDRLNHLWNTFADEPSDDGAAEAR